jgi:tetratricopeptide (TPR) repeat protein
LTTPGAYLTEAAVDVAQGRFKEAADDYAEFVARNPDHPQRADAQFNAAFYLQVTSPDGGESDSSVTGAARLEQSLKQLQKFIEDNPLHAKVARAKTLVGLLQFRLKHYKEAIDQLHSPGLRLEDPYVSLVILRTLASSYARIGDFESARSAYLQAASLPDNYSPDLDYQELSDLCKSMADQASTPEESRRYLELSAEQLSHAILTPGIDPVTKKRLQSLLAARQASGGAAPEAGVPPAAAKSVAPPAPAASPVTPPTEAPPAAAPTPPPAPAAPTTLNAEPDPRLEGEQLNAGAIKPPPASADSKDGKP